MDMASYCPLFIFNEKITREKCSKCQCPGGVQTRKGECKLGALVHTEILCPQEKIINAKGYNGKVTLPRGSQSPGAGINLDGDDNEPTDMDAIVVACKNARTTEYVMNTTPWKISINCDIHSPNQII